MLQEVIKKQALLCGQLLSSVIHQTFGTISLNLMAVDQNKRNFEIPLQTEKYNWKLNSNTYFYFSIFLDIPIGWITNFQLILARKTLRFSLINLLKYQR